MIKYILAVDCEESDDIRYSGTRVYLEKIGNEFRWTDNVFKGYLHNTVDEITNSNYLKKKDILDKEDGVVKRHMLYRDVFGDTIDSKEFIIVKIETSDINTLPENNLRINIGTEAEYVEYTRLLEKFTQVT